MDPQPGFERSPYELGLGWLVDLDAADFVGRDALLEQQNNGHPHTLRSFEIDGMNQPEDGAALYVDVDHHDAAIGIVCCSSWSWGLNKMIGNASIKSQHADLEEACVTLDGKPVKVKLGSGPFINLERRNQVPAPIEK